MAARRLRSRAASTAPAASPDVHEATGHDDLQLSDLPFFTDYPLARASHVRRKVDERAHCDASARVLLLHDGCALCHIPREAQHTSDGASDSSAASSDGATGARLVVCPGGEAVEALRESAQPAVFLGTARSSAGERWFALAAADRGRCEAQCGELAVSDAEGVGLLGLNGAAGEGAGLGWVNVRNSPLALPLQQGALAATAAGMLAWHRNNAFSATSGKALTATQGGWALTGADGERSLYPRVDPAIIVLPVCGEFCLLGHNARWKDGRFSALAGFAELGESLEGACCREVAEESGVQLEPPQLRYEESQPWPFPASLMLGFRATVPRASPVAGAAKENGHGAQLLASKEARGAAVDSGITQAELRTYLAAQCPEASPDGREITATRWLHWQWLGQRQGWLQRPQLHPQPQAAAFSFPGRSSLANRMLTRWIAECVGEWAGAAVPDCDIDEGTFKYIIIRLSDPVATDGGRSKLLVRGDRHSGYHNDVLQRAKREVRMTPGCAGLALEPLGGGRIEHLPGEGSVLVYGYSMAFGPAVHEVAVEIVRRAFPWYEADRVRAEYAGY